MYYDYAYAMQEAMSSMVLSLLMNLGSSLMSIVIYVFTSLSLYTIAKRRGISKPWMAWIPVVNCWILGSISDQYRYVARGETKSKRKVLLTLNIISGVLAVVFVVMIFVMAFDMVRNVMYSMDEEEMILSLLGSLGGMMGMTLPIMGISIAYSIIYYMALYDVYASCDPNNKVVYLVVGIFFGIAQAIFLFICRNKDGGMPPRKELPGAQPPYGGQYQQPYGQNQYGGQYQQPYGQNQYGGQYQQPYGQNSYGSQEPARCDNSAPGTAEHPQEDAPEQL